MAAQIFRTRLINPIESERFWEALTNFIENNNEEAISLAMESVITRLPVEEKTLIKGVVSWLNDMSANAVAAIISRILLGP